MPDAVVIGGGFFGCSIALYLKQRLKSVVLIEQEPALFQHASYVNQARIHAGYHYPRSLYTAYRSRVNVESFVKDYPECVVSNFTKLYAIARHHCKVSPHQFERFCSLIGAPLKPAPARLGKLFNPALIEAVYEVQEYAFDSDILRDSLRKRLDREGVELMLNTRLDAVEPGPRLLLNDGRELEARYVFNCTYAGLNRFCKTPLKFELAEIALIQPPEELRELGITVMCGPFFSTMPFPPRGLHSLSHVRYTPHYAWTGQDLDPYQVLRQHTKESHALHMLKDARRYAPTLAGATIVDSLFEVKTLLVQNEIDDGRPILMERNATIPGVYAVMGGKIDNIYDVMDELTRTGL